jgi:hypothetical protein
VSEGHVFTFAPANSSYRKMIKAIHYLTWPSDRRKPEGGGSDNNHPCVDSNQIFNNLVTSVGLSALFSIRNSVAPRHGFEPRFTAPKAAVLPLDDRGMRDERLAANQTDCIIRVDATTAVTNRNTGCHPGRFLRLRSSHRRCLAADSRLPSVFPP